MYIHTIVIVKKKKSDLNYFNSKATSFIITKNNRIVKHKK